MLKGKLHKNNFVREKRMNKKKNVDLREMK